MQEGLCSIFRLERIRLKSVEASVDVNGINEISGEWYYMLCHSVYGLRTCALRLTDWSEKGSGAHSGELRGHRTPRDPHNIGSVSECRCTLPATDL